MADHPFTPHADSIQTAWVLMCQQSRIATQPPVEELEAEFDRFLARVRRDAAREALDGLAVTYRDVSTLGILQYRDTHYPEKED